MIVVMTVLRKIALPPACPDIQHLVACIGGLTGPQKCLGYVAYLDNCAACLTRGHLHSTGTTLKLLELALGLLKLALRLLELAGGGGGRHLQGGATGE